MSGENKEPPAPPSKVVATREVTVAITFLIEGMDQQMAESWAMAGVSTALPQGSTVRSVAVGSKPASSSLVTAAGGALRKM